MILRFRVSIVLVIECRSHLCGPRGALGGGSCCIVRVKELALVAEPLEERHGVGGELLDDASDAALVGLGFGV